MLQEEVFITPLLEPGVVHHLDMALANPFPNAVEVDDILAVGIVRCQVGPAAEPFLGAPGEKAEIGVDRRHQGAARMEDERQARRGGIEPFTRKLAGEFLGHPAEYIRPIDACFFKDTPFGQDTRAAATAALAAPKVLPKAACTVQFFQGGANAVL